MNLFTRLRELFRSNPDLSTPQGRSHRRYKAAALTSGSAILARIASILLNFVSVPFALAYLGEEGFGLWMAMSSIIFFLTFADLGLGIGLQNHLADCYGRDDESTPRYLISSGMFIMLILCLAAVAVGLWVVPAVDLNRLVKANSPVVRGQIQPTAQAMLIALGIGFPAGMIQRIYNAYQRGYWGYLQQAIGSCLALVGVLLCIRLEWGLPLMAFLFIGGRHLALLAGGLLLFARKRWARPSLFCVSWGHSRQIFSLGVIALGAQLSSLVLIGGIPLVLAARLGLDAVTPFSVTQKLLGALTMLLTMSLWPLWTAYTEAASRADWSWVQQAFRRSELFTYAMVGGVFLGAALAGQWVIGVWTRDPAAVPSFSLLMAWNVWTVLQGIDVACTVCLSGVNRLLGQATYGLACGLAGLAVAYWVAGSHGPATTVWSAVLVGQGLRTALLRLEVFTTLRAAASHTLATAGAATPSGNAV